MESTRIPALKSNFERRQCSTCSSPMENFKVTLDAAESYTRRPAWPPHTLGRRGVIGWTLMVHVAYEGEYFRIKLTSTFRIPKFVHTIKFVSIIKFDVNRQVCDHHQV